MTAIYVFVYVALTLLATLMARLKRLSLGMGYLGVFFCSLLFTPLPAFFLFLFMPSNKPRAIQKAT